MEECELCGAKMKDVYVVNVDNVELRVCIKCAQGKKIISKVMEQKKGNVLQMPKKDKNEIPQIVENYGRIIHDARESMKLPMKVLAEMINEKETLLSRVEQQRTMPSVELTKKLEKALSIKLTEESQVQKENMHSYGNNEEATLGEFVTKKK
ncbi:MAG: multiprotein-bridging factor 1 family protein [Candidatus Micrarchaeaceae archaeon]|jgi:putative transcription factor